MKKIVEKPLVLNYERPTRDPLQYWISPRTLAWLLAAVGTALIAPAILYPFSLRLLAPAGYVCFALAIWVWKTEGL